MNGLSDMIFSPSEEMIKSSQMTLFQKRVEQKFQLSFDDYSQFHKWSVDKAELFWTELLLFYPIMFEGELNPACLDLSFARYGWFPDLKINFAKNMLRHKDSSDCALNFVHESGFSVQLSYFELYQHSVGMSSLIKDNIKKGDVLAAYMPNIPQTVVSMLATTAAGGIFTSTSSDFGLDGVLDRFSQSRPKVLVAAIGYEYNGKYFDQTKKILELEKRLPSLEKIILVDFLGRDIDLSVFKKAVSYNDLFDHMDGELDFYPSSFCDPLYIMYSSGTTGRPKCIVHSIGGTLLAHVKELGLHCNLQKEDHICYFTTCGWMMWNWMISSLFFGSKISLYEGSPSYPSLDKFFRIIDREQIHIFGTSPKFLKALEQSHTHFDSNFETLKLLLSTGAPLLPEQFDFIKKEIKADIPIVSICGGTDILGCFMLGNPNLEVYRGEIQCLGLGMDVAVFDKNGETLEGEVGELVCRTSFPSRPLCFLDDPSGSKINSAYFEKYPKVWHHGDFVELTKRGSVRVLGRSDATLNPGGVRIGTAEIYRQTEKISFIEDSLCVGKREDSDVVIVLFVKLKENEQLNDEKRQEIKTKIKIGCTPRHVPRYIYTVSDIPYTRSGKKMEIVVSNIINKNKKVNSEGCANPISLKEYENLKI